MKFNLQHGQIVKLSNDTLVQLVNRPSGHQTIYTLEGRGLFEPSPTREFFSPEGKSVPAYGWTVVQVMDLTKPDVVIPEIRLWTWVLPLGRDDTPAIITDVKEVVSKEGTRIVYCVDDQDEELRRDQFVIAREEDQPKVVIPFRMGDVVRYLPPSDQGDYLNGIHVIQESVPDGDTWRYSSDLGAWLQHEFCTLIKHADVFSMQRLVKSFRDGAEDDGEEIEPHGDDDPDEDFGDFDEN